MNKDIKIYKTDKRVHKTPAGEKCFECDNIADSMHHIVPYVRGGGWCIPVCTSCHSLIHHGKAVSYRHGELVKEGIEKARAKGKKIGKDRISNENEILNLLKNTSLSYREIAKKCKCSKSTVSRVSQRNFDEEIVITKKATTRPHKKG